jgi:3-hydroxyacyl-[acyl-carrier-protein] dehydratase
LKAVTLTDEVLHDHFPDFPVYPGALLVEAAAQLGGFLLEKSRNVANERAVLVSIEKAKFYRPAQPGDSVELFAEMGPSLDSAAKITVGADVNGEQVMRGALTFMLQRVESARLAAQREYLYELWTRPLPKGTWSK